MAGPSVIHRHILSVIASAMKGNARLRILDAGCGGGELMRYLSQELTDLAPEVKIEVSGFDVSDFSPHGARDLADNIQVIQTGEMWPYPDRSFDAVVSNQVLEHVADHRLFFRELGRVLRPGGISIHVFPLKECIYEPHVFIPFAHRIPIPAYINAMAHLGFLRKRALCIPGDGNFGLRATSYIKKYTNYLSGREIVRSAEAAGLRGSFDYTPHLYLAKVRSIIGVRPINLYSQNSWLDRLSFLVLRYVGSVTLVLRH